MTTASALTQDRSLSSAIAADLAGAAGRVRQVWARYALYRRTLSELRAMSNRVLNDLGLDRSHLAAIAYREVYGR